MKCTVMARLLIVFGLFGFLLQVHCDNQYDNHTLIRLHPTLPVHLNAVAQFQDPSGEVSVLKESRGVNDTLDILVPPNKLKFVHDYANSNGLTVENKQQNYGRIDEKPLSHVKSKVIANVLNIACEESNAYQNYLYTGVLGANVVFDADSDNRNNSILDYFELCHPLSRTLEDVSERLPRRRGLRNFQLYGYNSFAQIQEFIEEAARRRPNLVRLQDLGKSFEGRRMQLVKISAQPDAGNPIIFVDAGIHSREWVAPAMAMYLLNRLISDPDVVRIGGILDGVDWYILPVVNPDGYEYSRSGANRRLWRKTRSRTSKSHCYGVDGNRNYGYKWGVSGVSKNPCHGETYPGYKPFSEPETRMVRNIMMENNKRMKLYVSLHAYGQYLVYPWGYTGDYLPMQWKKLDDMAVAVSSAVTRAGGNPFKVLSAGKWYPAAGGSDDFAFGAVGVPYSYTMELTNGYEFTFPENLLHTVLPQFYEGFKEFGLQIHKEFGHPRRAR